MNKIKFDIWVEGYTATCESATAQLLASIEADTFNDAIKIYAKNNRNIVDFDRYGKDRHAIWGCELFDNRIEAQKAFG